MTMRLIETVTVGAVGISSIIFTNIPQDGSDLLLLTSTRDNNAAAIQTLEFTINDDKLDTISIRATGSIIISSTSRSEMALANNSTASAANTFNNARIYIGDYTSSSKHGMLFESVTATNDITNNRLGFDFGADTILAPVTSLALISQNTFVQYSSASLYKITKGSIPGIVVS